jgi:hypothetical protein
VQTNSKFRLYRAKEIHMTCRINQRDTVVIRQNIVPLNDVFPKHDQNHESFNRINSHFLHTICR